MTVLTGIEHSFLCDLHRICSALFKHGDAQFLTANLQLLNCCRTINVTSYQQRVLTLTFHQASQLTAVGGLTCTLQAAEHHNSRTVRVGGNVLDLTAHELGQFFVYDLYDHLGGT